MTVLESNILVKNVLKFLNLAVLFVIALPYHCLLYASKIMYTIISVLGRQKEEELERLRQAEIERHEKEEEEEAIAQMKELDEQLKVSYYEPRFMASVINFAIELQATGPAKRLVTTGSQESGRGAGGAIAPALFCRYVILKVNVSNCTIHRAM